jgi:hypothetical protein
MTTLAKNVKKSVRELMALSEYSVNQGPSYRKTSLPASSLESPKLASMSILSKRKLLIRGMK